MEPNAAFELEIGIHTEKGPFVTVIVNAMNRVQCLQGTMPCLEAAQVPHLLSMAIQAHGEHNLVDGH
jgi:hypothetical protein